jgi:lauroyl-KDO2-lipid IV(A) myristoyltransferase
MNKNKTHSYQPGFQFKFLLPQYWGWWLVVLLLWLYSFTPKWIKTRLANGLGSIAWRRNKRRRDIAQLNVDWCFPELSASQRQQMVRQNFQLTIRVMLDYGLLWWASRWRIKRNIVIEGMEHIEAARAAGRNIILLTGHTVPLDFGAAAMTIDLPMVGLIKETRNPLMEWLMTRGRTRFQGRVHLRDVVGMRPVIRDIKQDYAFYYLPDEDLTHIKGGDWIWSPFFGVQTATITALGRLSKVSKAAILPAMTYYNHRLQKYQVVIHPMLEDYPTGDDEADTHRMNQILESMIRQNPEQYMWTLRIFKTRPEGEIPPYR